MRFSTRFHRGPGFFFPGGDPQRLDVSVYIVATETNLQPVGLQFRRVDGDLRTLESRGNGLLKRFSHLLAARTELPGVLHSIDAQLAGAPYLSGEQPGFGAIAR